MISNWQLVSDLKVLVAKEIKITADIIDHLREVESRKLYLKMGYASLFDFCMRELKYSEASAQRRIAAMRLLKELPEMREKIISGDLSLSVISQAQSHFRKNLLNRDEKIELLKKLENTSTRECERELLKIDPKIAQKDKVRAITDELTEIKMTVSSDFMKKLEQLKNLYSHSKPNASNQEILEFAIDQLLVKKAHPLPAPEVKARQNNGSRYIPKAVVDRVWQKSNSRCCYVDPFTKRRCSAEKFLEIDHIHAYSKSGSNDVENLQLLCSAHNLLKSNL